jgi:hypothetical protein
VKYTIEKFTGKGLPKLIEGTKDGKAYSFWGAMFYADGKLIKYNGDKTEIEPLKVGSVVEGTLIEKPFTTETGEVMAYQLKIDRNAEIKAELEDLRARVEILEDAVFSANKSDFESDEKEPDVEPDLEIDVEDVPF